MVYYNTTEPKITKLLQIAFLKIRNQQYYNLIKNNIPIVNEIPERWGVYCMREEQNNVYKVFIVYFDKESGIYIKEYQYSLRWINIIAKSIDDKLENDKEMQIIV